jgi:hypothetical protein
MERVPPRLDAFTTLEGSNEANVAPTAIAPDVFKNFLRSITNSSLFFMVYPFFILMIKSF